MDRTPDRLNENFYLRKPTLSNPTITEDTDPTELLRGGDGRDYFFARKEEGEADRVFKTDDELLIRI